MPIFIKTFIRISNNITKIALEHLTKELSVRLAKNIRVNCAAFGGVEGRK